MVTETRDRLDVLFVNPGNAQAIYQGLADRFSAIEPPTWALLLAEAFIDYHSSEGFLNRVRDRFGDEALRNCEEIKKYWMRRRLVEEAAN